MDIRHYQQGSQSAYSVEIGGVTLFFSYATLIGVWSINRKVRVENQWGPTTGKHINAFGLKEAEVVPFEDIEQIAYREICSQYAG